MIKDILELNRLMRRSLCSLDELHHIQTIKLRDLVRHSFETVPYYRNLFRSVGMAPSDIRTAEDLRHLPITTKASLREAGLDNILSCRADRSRCISAVTSGSTGKPFTVYASSQDMRRYRMVAFRALLKAGMRPLDRLALLGTIRPYRTRLYQRAGLFRSVSIHPMLPAKEQVKLLKTMDPTALWFYPSPLRSLLKNSPTPLNEIIRPRMLISGAEVLDPPLKRTVSGLWNSEIFNFYGAVEIGRIASECPAHEGLHVNMDHVVLECLDDRGQPVVPGEAGTAVVTTLDNQTMPLIRYRLGDRLTVLNRQCSCGCAFPLILPPHGREADILRFHNGTAMSTIALTPVLHTVDGLEQYRIIQESYDRLVLLLVLHKALTPESLSGLRDRLLAEFPCPVRLEIRVVDAIEEEKLKFRAFISRLTLETGACQGKSDLNPED
ncbi:MAG: hypothetical protein V1793_05635 [Pseudomonadota bacterium]